MNAQDTGQQMSGTITTWDEQLAGFGKVVFRQKMSKMVFAFGLVIAAVVIGLFMGFRSSGGDTTTVVGVSIVVIPVMVLLFAWPILRSRKTTVAVETDGIRLTNGVLVPWHEIVDSGVWSYRGNEMVTLKVTGAYMGLYQSRQSRSARMLTKMNAALGGGDALYLPGMLDADPDDLSAWIAMLIARHQARSSAFGAAFDEIPAPRS